MISSSSSLALLMIEQFDHAVHRLRTCGWMPRGPMLSPVCSLFVVDESLVFICCSNPRLVYALPLQSECVSVSLCLCVCVCLCLCVTSCLFLSVRNRSCSCVSPIRVGFGLSHVVDVDWRLDYYIKVMKMLLLLLLTWVERPC